MNKWWRNYEELHSGLVHGRRTKESEDRARILKQNWIIPSRLSEYHNYGFTQRRPSGVIDHQQYLHQGNQSSAWWCWFLRRCWWRQAGTCWADGSPQRRPIGGLDEHFHTRWQAPPAGWLTPDRVFRWYRVDFSRSWVSANTLMLPEPSELLLWRIGIGQDDERERICKEEIGFALFILLFYEEWLIDNLYEDNLNICKPVEGTFWTLILSCLMLLFSRPPRKFFQLIPSSSISLHMGSFPQDGENEQNLS